MTRLQAFRRSRSHGRQKPQPIREQVELAVRVLVTVTGEICGNVLVHWANLCMPDTNAVDF